MKTLPALYLIKNQGELIYTGELPSIVKARHFKNKEGEPHILVSGDKAYGLITMGIAKEFPYKEIYNKKRFHSEQTQEWQGLGYEHLYKHPYKFVPFHKPLDYKHRQGVRGFDNHPQIKMDKDSKYLIEDYFKGKLHDGHDKKAEITWLSLGKRALQNLNQSTTIIRGKTVNGKLKRVLGDNAVYRANRHVIEIGKSATEPIQTLFHELGHLHDNKNYHSTAYLRAMGLIEKEHSANDNAKRLIRQFGGNKKHIEEYSKVMNPSLRTYKNFTVLSNYAPFIPKQTFEKVENVIEDHMLQTTALDWYLKKTDPGYRKFKSSFSKNYIDTMAKTASPTPIRIDSEEKAKELGGAYLEQWEQMKKRNNGGRLVVPEHGGVTRNAILINPEFIKQQIANRPDIERQVLRHELRHSLDYDRNILPNKMFYHSENKLANILGLAALEYRASKAQTRNPGIWRKIHAIEYPLAQSLGLIKRQKVTEVPIITKLLSLLPKK